MMTQVKRHELAEALKKSIDGSFIGQRNTPDLINAMQSQVEDFMTKAYANGQIPNKQTVKCFMCKKEAGQVHVVLGENIIPDEGHAGCFEQDTPIDLYYI